MRAARIYTLHSFTVPRLFQHAELEFTSLNVKRNTCYFFGLVRYSQHLHRFRKIDINSLWNIDILEFSKKPSFGIPFILSRCWAIAFTGTCSTELKNQVSSTSKNPSKGGYLAQHALLDQLPILEVWKFGWKIRNKSVEVCFLHPKKIQSPKLRMVSWNLNTFRFGGDYTPPIVI